LPTKVIGKKLYKKTQNKATIFACNHQTNNDAIIIKARVNLRFKFIAKASLFKNKFIGWIFRGLGGYPVNRGGNDIKAVKTTLEHLKNNRHLVIFPEGTRVKPDESVEYKNGLALFALKTDCYVVPSVFRKRTRAFVFNKLVIGEPFKFSDMEEFKNVKPTKEVLNRASEVLQDKMNYLKSVDLKEYKKQIKEKNGI
jgi:1-acyl-sn-glycerol-3-phosphate acyltransferase